MLSTVVPADTVVKAESSQVLASRARLRASPSGINPNPFTITAPSPSGIPACGAMIAS